MIRLRQVRRDTGCWRQADAEAKKIVGDNSLNKQARQPLQQENNA
jgi:hypothetical protein